MVSYFNLTHPTRAMPTAGCANALCMYGSLYLKTIDQVLRSHFLRSLSLVRSLQYLLYRRWQSDEVN
ncbi:MAG: hypothetical protein ACRAVC_11355 [Trichormus sp.]